MKPDESDKDGEVDPPPSTAAGDPIGSTVYSERFVLRLLLKLGDLGAPAPPGDEAELEQDLCVLWDMTAERDVVDFLLQHAFLEHARYAWPRVPSARIAEILLGIIANMCCYPPAVAALRAARDFCATIVQLVHSDDTLLLVQVLRLIKACLYRVRADDAARWLRLFAAADLPPALAFILANSSNKDLLCTALETLNAVCSTCDADDARARFAELFVTAEVADGVLECVRELSGDQRARCGRGELERAFLVALEVTGHLAGFDAARALYRDKKEKTCGVMADVLEYYRVKTLEEKDSDLYLADVVDSIGAISDRLDLHGSGDTERCAGLAFALWAGLRGAHEAGPDDALASLERRLGGLACRYLERCPEDKLAAGLALVGAELDALLGSLDAESAGLHRAVTRRADHYRTRIKTD